MNRFEGTKTEENLRNALAGEAQASVKYLFFGEKAREDGYEQIGAIFDETSHNEEEHAKIWYKLLNNGRISDTEDNLKASIGGELYEWTNMYKKFADDARKDGFDSVAKLFEEVAVIESIHETRYQKLLDNIEDGTVFTKEGGAKWQCRNCGFVYIGKEAPLVCPVCGYPQAFYQVKCENY